MKIGICLLLLVTVTNASNLDLFWNLYETVARSSRIIHDVTEGVGAVSKAIAAIDVFLDLSAEDHLKDSIKSEEAASSTEAQEPTTPEPDKQVEPIDPKDIPKFSGCGALGFHIRDDNLPIEKLTSCCGTHDACYSASCKANKRECDYKLRSCLFNVCDKSKDRSISKSCRGAAKLLFSGTMVLSNQQYADNQQELNCPSKKKSKENKKEKNERGRR